ncbi:hypothetical protein MW887_011472 [Aspergillus wentii]|nr:hypothetical protein MW887_011472 [Aspergillus wentii]
MAEHQDRIILPGFGRPLDDYKQDERPDFDHAIRDLCQSLGVVLRERRMIDFINQISDKPEWDRKVFDEDIVSKWMAEACVWKEELNDDYLSAAMFDYCIRELRDKAAYFQKSQMVCVLDCETAIVKSDTAVSQDLMNALRQNVRALEEVPDSAKDWHPGSDHKVLDLLHPSLFPLVHGKSRALPYRTVPLDSCTRFIGEGEIVNPELHTKVVDRWDYKGQLKPWGNFQWLPSNVQFEDGRPSITSYINNLHPHDHKELYGALEGFLAAAIPLWNECLSWDVPRLRIKHENFSDEDFTVPNGVTYTPSEQDMIDACLPDMPMDLRPRTLQEARDQDLTYTDGFVDWFEQNRVLIQLEPEHFRSREDWREQTKPRVVDLQKDFAKSGLQVIFKLANIHLTPEGPEYTGGSWHIEGALNEHISATALYYYDEENITPSHLSFRQSVESVNITGSAAQGEYHSAELYFGVEYDDPAIQKLGSVLTRSGRLLTFPNVLQHKVQPFRLADPTKPGHRKILAMFLVDPHIPILSTANVPPQRRDWWADELRNVPPFHALPLEIFNNILEYVDDFPMSWEDAVEVRQKLMNERGALTDRVDTFMRNETYSFCEH